MESNNDIEESKESTEIENNYEESKKNSNVEENVKFGNITALVRYIKDNFNSSNPPNVDKLLKY